MPPNCPQELNKAKIKRETVHGIGRHSEIQTTLLEPPNAPVILAGWRLSSPEAAVLGAEFLKATRILDREARNINADTPWTSPKARSLDRLSLEAKIGQIPVSELSKLALREQLETDNGVPAERQSYLGVLAMIKEGGCKSYWEDTEVYRCREGNDELAEQFRQRLPAHFADAILSLPRDSFRKRGPFHLRSANTGKIGSPVTIRQPEAIKQFQTKF